MEKAAQWYRDLQLEGYLVVFPDVVTLPGLLELTAVTGGAVLDGDGVGGVV